MSSRSRRMTLSGAPKRRQSLEPTQASASKTARPTRHNGIPRSGRRQTMIPRVGRENVEPQPPSPAKSTSSRRGRLSIAPSKPPKDDNRPIQDRVFQKKCIDTIVSFVKTRSNNTLPISTHLLQKPSSKDFQKITTFLLRQVDHGFQRGADAPRFEDEVSMSFRALGYPFTISKTSLGLAGATQTWPKLLVALTWLVHKIENIEAHSPGSALETPANFQTLEHLERISDEVFFDYLKGSYGAFMVDDCVALEYYHEAIRERIANDDSHLESQVERIVDVNSNLMEHIHEAHGVKEELAARLAKRDELATDLKEFDALMDDMNGLKTDQENKVQQRTDELAETTAKLERMRTYVQELEQGVKEQEISLDDAAKMKEEIKRLQEAMSQVEAGRNEQQDLLSEFKTKISASFQKLDALVTSYNKSITVLALDLGPDFGSNKADISKSKVSDDMAKFLGVDLEHEVHAKVDRAFNERKTMWEEVKEQYQDVLDVKSSRENSRSEISTNLKTVQEKIENCNQAIEAMKKAHESKIAVRRSEIDAMEAKTKALCDPAELEKQLASYERRCAELEASHIELKHLHKKEEQSILQKIDEACNLIEEHQTYMQQLVADVNLYWEETLAQVEDWELKGSL